MAKSNTTESTGWIPFAWMGWRVAMPEHWRALRIRGEWDRGAVVIGDGVHAVFQLKWWRPNRKRFNAATWIRRRLRKEAGVRETDSQAPKPDCVDVVGWHTDAESDEPKILWYGYSDLADMVLELLVNADIDSEMRHTVTDEVLTSLRLQKPGEDVETMALGSRFVVPARFRLQRWDLKLGDQSLQFSDRKGRELLLLRQVYPGKLALSRKPLKGWLRSKPFPDRRRYIRQEESEQVDVPTADGPLGGLVSRGVKRLPWPLGWLAPRRVVRLVCHHQGTDRVLMAMQESRDSTDEAMVRQCLAQMGRADAVPAAEST